ncbi:hypothetical protein VTO73DRAFT_11691 [Trametes versicolor]
MTQFQKARGQAETEYSDVRAMRCRTSTLSTRQNESSSNIERRDPQVSTDTPRSQPALPLRKIVDVRRDMSSVSSASDAELVSFYQDTRTINNVDVAITTLLAYDALLCIDNEIQYVWRSPKTSRKLSPIIYLYNSCTALGWFGYIVEVLALLGPASLTILRVYALSGKNKAVTGVVLLLGTGPFLVNVCTLYQDVTLNLPSPLNCASYIVATPTAYVATLISLNIVVMTMAVLTVLAHPYEIVNVFLPLIDPISSILNSRFLLALYETTAHRERGGPSLSSFSLDFGQAFPSGGAPSDLPEFLSEFAGPIHPGIRYGPELYDAESEPEAEVRVHAGLGADGSS